MPNLILLHIPLLLPTNVIVLYVPGKRLECTCVYVLVVCETYFLNYSISSFPVDRKVIQLNIYSFFFRLFSSYRL